MLSEFRKKKLIGLFRMNDLDRDGRISGEDFDRVTNNYAVVYGEEPGSPNHQELVSRYREQWTQLQAFDADGDGVVGLDEYLAGMEAWLADREAWEASIDATIAAFYRVVDRDKDGRIDAEELVLNWRAHGLEEKEARAVFSKLDRDGDGKISKDEMVTNLIEAMYAEEPDAPGNWLALPEGS